MLMDTFDFHTKKVGILKYLPLATSFSSSEDSLDSSFSSSGLGISPLPCISVGLDSPL